MSIYTQQLRTLQEQIARKKHLEATVGALEQQQRGLADKTTQLKNIMLNEQQDVERLQQGSLASFFYELIGKKDEKLAKEQREAYAARLKYEAAIRELEAVEAGLRRSRAELESLRHCENGYEQLLQDVLMEIKTSGHPHGAEIVRIEQNISQQQSRIKELDEAIAAGDKAMKTIAQIQSYLKDAEDWGTWDLFGGGLLSDIAKHDALDKAQDAVELLQMQLRAFKTELVDVSVETNIQISIEGFLGFADFFFDGLFADWAVMDKIEQAAAQVSGTKAQLQEVITRLHSMKAQAEQELRSCRQKLEALATAES